MRNILIILIINAFLLSCGPIIDPCFEELMFEIPVELTGISDTISVGDSFTLKSTISYDLEELNGNGTFNTEDIEIPIRFTIYKVDESPIRYIKDSLISIKGTSSINTFYSENAKDNVGYSHSIKFEDNESIREFKFNVKVNEIGLYIFSTESLYDHQYDPSLLDGCQENLEYNSVRVNEGDIYHNNYDMLFHSPDSSIIIENLKNEYNYKNFGCYTFYVK